MAVVLIGMMGCGKSTIGRVLSKQLNWQHVDLDREIERSAGMSVARIFSEKGEAVFREAEQNTLKAMPAGGEIVLSVGGGVPLSKENFEQLRRIGTVVYLKATLATILERVIAKPEKRPLIALNTEERTTELLAQRDPIYLRAEVVILVDGKSPRIVSDEIRSVLNV